jgi:osomolarity two-component system response regulator SKN7
MYTMPIRILIAEDELLSREMLVTLATHKGYEVTAVTDGVDLLTVAAAEKFDVIITDLMMSNLDGAAASEILKMQENSTPVIALTALTPEGISHIQDRFTKIYHKPCNYKELFAYIDSLVGK